MLWKRRAYLDTAAGIAGNPSSPHEEGRRAKEMLEDARAEIARLTEVQTDDVIFTSGATESNALAILGSVRALRARAGRDTPGRNNMHVLYLPSAHASLVENIKLLESEGVHVQELPIRNARIDVNALAKMIRRETVLVAMDAVCGETGVVWNTREVAEVLKRARGHEVSARPLLHVDASQSPHTEKISREHFGADLLTFDASKVSSSRGIGVLIAHRTIPLVPLYAGGGQERGLRPGTESPELAKTFATALATATKNRFSFQLFSALARANLTSLVQKKIQNVYINEGVMQVPHIVNLSFTGRDTDYLVALLDEGGFAVSTRSACETDSESGSRAVFALTQDVERARTTLRISWDSKTTARDLKRFAKALISAVAFIDSSGSR